MKINKKQIAEYIEFAKDEDPQIQEYLDLVEKQQQGQGLTDIEYKAFQGCKKSIRVNTHYWLENKKLNINNNDELLEISNDND